MERITLKQVKPNLEIGREYLIGLFPCTNFTPGSGEKVKARYIGESNNLHLFANDDVYIPVYGSHMTQVGDTIMYHAVSSFMLKSTKKYDSQLVKLLKDLGEI